VRVSFEIPEDVARAFLVGDKTLSEAAVESLAAEGYRSGSLSESQLMRLLGLSSRFAVHAWLRDRRIPYRYSEADFAEDLATLSELGLR
jgi:hypothetical protein